MPVRWLLGISMVLITSTGRAQLPAPASRPVGERMRDAQVQLRRFLALDPTQIRDPSAFFRAGKTVIDELESVIVSDVKPHSVLAVCDVGLALKHLWDHEAHLWKHQKDWLRRVYAPPAGYFRHCQALAEKHRIDVGQQLAGAYQSPRAPGSVVACRPADLFGRLTPSAHYLRQCGQYVRAEVRRLLKAARRQADRDDERALGLMERAHRLDRASLQVRWRKVEAMVRVGNLTGAMREVDWWRRTHGEDAADRLVELIHKTMRRGH